VRNRRAAVAELRPTDTVAADTNNVRLRRAATLFALAVILHNADHLRRGVNDSPRDVLIVGMAAILVEVALVVVVFQRHRIAPLATAVGGATLAAGYAEVHFLPTHRLLSDSLLGGDASALSRAAASFEVVAALALATAGLIALAANGAMVSATKSSSPERLADALRLPVPAFLVATQVVGYVVVVIQLLR
jgi:hypothetical protein